MVKISIIMPVYNGAEFLVNSIKSVDDGRYGIVPVIVVSELPD